MKKINLAITLICLMCSFWGNAEPIIASKLYATPDNSMLRLSPDGKFLTAYYRSDKGHYINLIDPHRNKFLSRVDLGLDSKLDTYQWLNSSQLYFSVIYRNQRISLIGSVNKNNDVDVKLLKSKGYLLDSLTGFENQLLFAKRKKSRSDTRDYYYDLYRINIVDLINDDFSDAFKIKHDPKNVSNYFYDEQYKRILTTEYKKKEKSIIVKYIPDTGGDWTNIFKIKDYGYKIEPVGFFDANSLAVLTNKNSDKMVLRAYDFKSKILGEVLYQHPEYDLKSAAFDDQGKLVYVTYLQHGLTKFLYFDSDDSQFIKRLNKSFENKEAYVVDESADERFKLIYVNGSDEPGEYFFYNQQKNSVNRLFVSHLDLEDKSFSPSQHLNVTTSDGTVIEAFLTMPVGYDYKTLLVMPHGGPIAVQESDRFNKNVQYYASRGFTVLRVNFRGSAGFGKAFQTQGVGEFGRLIEEDITAAVNHVTELHNFENTCAIGSSYGGYSAVMLSIKHPEQYDCVVGSFGVYDLPLLFNASNYRSGKEHRKRVSKTVGEYHDDLRLVSPIYLFEQLKTPLMLLAGRNDKVADFEHTNRLHYLLKRQGHNVDTMFYDETGHGHYNWFGNRHQSAISSDYILRTLGLKRPEPNNLNVSAKEAIAEDFAIIADGYSFDNQVPDDKKKALEYYHLAAEYNHPRSVFNIGAHYHRGDELVKDLGKAVELYKKSAKLEHQYAFTRLGRMYMEGEHVTKDWGKAHQYLEKAQLLDDNPRNNFRLARFYCIAPDKYKNFDKCLELMALKPYLKQSEVKHKKAKKELRETIAWILFEGQLTTNEQQKITDMAIEVFELTDTETTIENLRMGTFNYIESSKFGTNGKYELAHSGSAVSFTKKKSSRFGVAFELDVPGFSVNDKAQQVAIAIRWSKTLPDGSKEPIDNELYWGVPSGDWLFLKSISTIEEKSTWTLEIYDMAKNKLYTQEFFIDPDNGE